MWIKFGDEVYIGKTRTARCPECIRALRTKPACLSGKEDLIRYTTGRDLARY
jgi:hypothetical protein